MLDDFVEWPVPVLKPESEWNEFDRDFIDFMRTAYAEGFRPRFQDGTAIEVENASNSRQAFLVFRGTRNGWEPLALGDGPKNIRLGPCFFLPEFHAIFVRPPFRSVAYFALEWLRGNSLESVLNEFVFDGKRGLTLKTMRAQERGQKC